MSASLVQDAPNTILLHNDIIRIFPLDEAYPRSPCPCHYLKNIEYTYAYYNASHKITIERRKKITSMIYAFIIICDF